MMMPSKFDGSENWVESKGGQIVVYTLQFAVDISQLSPATGAVVVSINCQMWSKAEDVKTNFTWDKEKEMRSYLLQQAQG